MFKFGLKHSQFEHLYTEQYSMDLLHEFNFGARYFAGDAVLTVDKESHKVSFQRFVKEEDYSMLKEIKTKDGEYNIVLDIYDATNLFHCLHFSVIRILTLNKTINNVNFYINQKDYDFYNFSKNIEDDKYHNMFKDYLQLLSDKNISIIPINGRFFKDDKYIMKNYILAHIPKEFGFCPEDLSILQNNIKDIKPIFKDYKKIYATRPDTKYDRVPKNEKIMQDYFKSLGFTIVNLDDYSIEEQISIGRNAEIFAGWSGSSFSQILFSSNDKIVLEFTYTPNKSKYYWQGQNQLRKSRDEQSRRYDFDWAIITSQTGATHVKINFEKIDTCEEAIDVLKNKQSFQNIVSYSI